MAKKAGRAAAKSGKTRGGKSAATKSTPPKSSEHTAYNGGILARNNRQAADDCPYASDDPLRLEWLRGWSAQRQTEADSKSLLEEMVGCSLSSTIEEIEKLTQDQRFALLDWLDTAPEGGLDGIAEEWDAFEGRRPAFVGIPGEMVEGEDETSLKVVVFGELTPATETPTDGAAIETLAEVPADSPATSEAASPEVPQETTQATSPTPLPAPTTVSPSPLSADDSSILAEIKEINERFRKLDARVVVCESDVKSAKGRLSDAQEERDKVGRELSDLIADSNSGQRRLPFEKGVGGATGSAGAETGHFGVTLSTTGDSAPSTSASPSPLTPPEDFPLRFLGQKGIREIVGSEVVEQQKAQDDPIGLSDTQLDKLEAACESSTICGLEKWIASDAYWSRKIKGFGEKAINRVVSTLAAFRRVKPMRQE